MSHEAGRDARTDADPEPAERPDGTPAPSSPLRRAAAFTLLLLAALTGGRIALLALYPDDVAGLGASELVFVFARGLLFDVSLTAGLFGLPLFVAILPFRWARSATAQRTCGWLCYAMFVLVLFMLFADLVYYDYVHRHIGPEIAIATHDLDQNVDLVLQQYRLVLAAFVATSVAALFVWRRLLRGLAPGHALPPHRTGLAPRLAATVVAGLVIAVVAHGAPPWQARLKIEDAYEGVPPHAARLVLSGPFSIVQFLARTRDVWNAEHMAWSEAVATTADLLVAGDEIVDDAQLPIARRRDGATAPTTRPNVVVVLLEGWNASDVDVLRVQAGEESLGVTPCFDALSREGVLLTRHYACGQRTRNGVAAVVAGLPSLPGMPYLGEGLEAMRLAYLGSMAASEGYSTYWLQAVQADSQRQDEIARWAGFEHFTSSEDIPVGEPVPCEPDTGSRAWDHDLFDEALRQIRDAPRPFLAFVQTADTHEPYLWPNDDWKRFPLGSRNGRYRNALLYGDWALGRFFDGARRDGWFDDTIIVVVSDHTQRQKEGRSEAPDLFHIPCVVLAPGLAPAVSDRVCSQTDIIPTIAHLAGWRARHAAFGRSLLDDSRDATRGALCTAGELLLRIERSGWVARTSTRRVDSGSSEPDADLDAIEHRMLAAAQVYSVLMLRDRLMPPR